MAKYDSDSIQTHVGLDAIRGSPAMYIGSTGADGVFLIARELLDNSLDDALAGRNKFVGIAALKDGSFIVQDYGPGVPQGIKKIQMVVSGKSVINKIPTMEAVFGRLHTSGKYNSKAYKVSRGSHGCGAKGTNATSLFFKVWTKYEGKIHHVGFEKGKLTTPVSIAKAPKNLPFGSLKRGTVIHFKPDPTIFKETTKFPASMLDEWATVTSYLCPGFEIVAKSPSGKEKVWKSKNGPLDYIMQRMKELRCKHIIDNAPVFQYKTELADIVVAFTTNSNIDLKGFTSGLNNPDGGVHVDAVNTALYEAIKPYKKKRGPDFTAHDFRDGILGLVNVNLHKAEFTGQNKSKLTDRRIGTEFVQDLTKAAATFYSKNKSFAAILVEKAGKIAQLKTKFKASASAVRELNKIKRQGMPVKYASYDPRTPVKDREVYLVEGDSAAAGLKTHKYPYQACLPLRGKIINALSDTTTRVMASKEVINILGALGFDFKAENPYAKLEIGKIIILTDPDPDGAHIECLLLAFLYKFLPGLIERGMVYVALTHEFYSTYKGKVYFGANLKELRTKLNKVRAPERHPMHHIKGWGEISGDLLRIMALDPKSRKLVQIQMDGNSNSIEQLMGKDASRRKQLLQKI